MYRYGTMGVWAEPPVGSRFRAHGQGVRKAENFLAFKHQKEVANLLLYFETSENSWPVCGISLKLRILSPSCMAVTNSTLVLRYLVMFAFSTSAGIKVC